MKMLEGYARMVEFFESIEYWKLRPMPELAQGGLRLLAEPRKQYVAYYPEGGRGTVELEAGNYRSRWYDPHTGVWAEAGEVRIAEKGRWAAPGAPDAGDWVLLVTNGSR